MRHVNLSPVFAVDIGGNEERVRSLDRGASKVIKLGQVFTLVLAWLAGCSLELEIPQLYVARAVAEALIHIDPITVRCGGDKAVHAIAATRVHLDAEQADRFAVRHSFAGGVAWLQGRADIERGRRRRGHEAGSALDKGGPGVIVAIHTAKDDERELGIEVPMLIRHEIANDPLADDLHTLGDTDFFLDELLAFVPGRQFCQSVGHVSSPKKGSGTLRRAPECGSGGEANRSPDKVHEARQRFDTTKQPIDRRISGEIHVAFRGAGHVAVDCDVGDRRAFANQPFAVGKLSFEFSKDRMGATNDFFRIELGTKDGDQAGRRRTISDLTGSYRQPALDRCGALQVIGQPVRPSGFLGKVDQDRVGIRYVFAVVVENRNLAKRVHLEEIGRLVRAGHEVHLNQLMRQVDQ
ncbi:hypothetical protein D3C87_1299590 [compost metagenome]